jgi:hypothetical protein
VEATIGVFFLHVELTTEVKHTSNSFSLSFDLVNEITLYQPVLTEAVLAELKISAGTGTLL